jgi:AraC-like DNA-binding protein
MSLIRLSLEDEPFLMVRSLATDHQAGHEVGSHAHDWHQLIHVASGVMTVATPEGRWTAPPHWAVWAPAGLPHAISLARASRLRTLYLRPRWAQGAPERCGVVAVSPLLRELILRTTAQGALDRRRSGDRAMGRLILAELRQTGARPFDLPQPRTVQLQSLASALLADPSGRQPVSELARGLGLGARTLERRFRDETGLSIGQWRRQARLQEALRRLAAGESVKAVSSACGYAEPSAFVSAFKAMFGRTPARYFQL